MTALAASEQPNGRYIYGAAGSFPNATYQNTNYWVDPVFAFTTSALPGGGSVIAAPVCQQFITPTPTATPDLFCRVSFISQATAQAIPIDRRQELWDMGIIPHSDPNTPLRIRGLNTPTINAIKRPDAAIEWSANNFIVHQRVAFPQGTNDQQIWYLVSSPNIPALSRFWVPVRYEGYNYSTVPDPCNNDPRLELTPSALTFTYDRRSAADFAIVHSYDSNGSQPQLVSGGRATRRVYTNGPASSLRVPFADFYYSYLANQQGTASAVFISEAIWAGGLPMTTGNNNPPPDPNNSCLGDPSGSRTDEGWRYCAFALGASNPWDFHQVLVPYFTNFAGFGYNNNVIGATNEGQIVQFGTSNFLDAIDSLGPLMGGASSNRENNLLTGFIDQPQMPAFTQLMQTSFQNSQLQRGDYVYIDTPDAHGLMVVGWGEIKACANVIYTEYLGNPSVRYSVDQLGITYTASRPVPWVADFTRAQNQIPRPFYCTWYQDFDRPYPDIGIFGPHDWYFFRLKDTLSFAPNPTAIWVDPNWGW